MADPLDLARPIDPERVKADVQTIMSDGFRSLSFDHLSELQFFVICHTLKEGAQVFTWDNLRLSTNALRDFIVQAIERGSEAGHFRRSVAEALFGIDAETADLLLEGRQTVAGRRYRPDKPLSYHGIRKKPYGQQWKIITYVADRLIADERGSRHTLQHPESVMSGNSVGGLVNPGPRSAPALPSEDEWENALGYRWRTYERVLICSHDFSVLTYRTTVYLTITVPHTRLYVHRHYPTLDLVSRRLPLSEVTIGRTRDSSPAVHVGSVELGSRHPGWLIDYFDFGPGTQRGDELCLVFEHTYNNPWQYPPLHVTATPEFSGIEDFEIRAERRTERAPNTETLNGPLAVYRPPRDRQQTLFVQPQREADRYQLRDPADWPRVKELRGRIDALEEKLGDLDAEYQSYFRVLEDPTAVDEGE